MAQKKKIKKITNKIPTKASKLPKVEKELKDFIGDEEGKMTRKDVAKLGVSIAVLGMMMQPGAAQGGTTTHTNTAQLANPPGACASHTNVTTHSNHSNHSDGGWMC